MENFNQGPKEYRKELSNVIKDVKKIDPKSAEFLRDSEKEKPRYQEAETLIRFQHKLEKELGEFESATFNTHHVESIDDKELQEIKNLGYEVEKQVFVSLNKAGNNEGFELLKAIDNELKKGIENIKIYVVNEFDWDKSKVTEPKIPFQDMPLETKKQYEGTIKQALELSKLDEKSSDQEVYKTIGSYHGQSFVRTVNQIRENDCELVQEWVKYLADSFDKSGFRRHEYNTYSEGNDMTMSHSDPVSDPKTFKDLFDSFLKQRKIELVNTSKKIGDYEKAIPVATEAYNILLNTDGMKYGWKGDHWREGCEARDERGKKDTYGEQITLELMARPKSIFDKNYAFGQERVKKINRY